MQRDTVVYIAMVSDKERSWASTLETQWREIELGAAMFLSPSKYAITGTFMRLFERRLESGETLAMPKLSANTKFIIFTKEPAAPPQSNAAAGSDARKPPRSTFGLLRSEWEKQRGHDQGWFAHGKMYSDGVPWHQPLAGDLDLLDAATPQTNTGIELDGYFVAPHTASYTFMTRGSVECGLSVGSSAEPDSLKRLAYCVPTHVARSDGSDGRSYVDSVGQVAEPVQLVRGERYAFRFNARVDTWNHAKAFLAAVRIHHKPEDNQWNKTKEEAQYHSWNEEQSFKLEPKELVPEVDEFVVENANGGYFTLVDGDRVSERIYINDTAVAATQLESVLSSFLPQLLCKSQSLPTAFVQPKLNLMNHWHAHAW